MASQHNNRPSEADRRLLPRNPVSTVVYVGGRGRPPIRANARNLSSLGVFLEPEEGESLDLREGRVVTLTFTVELGNLVRLHRKKAVVAHVSERGAGLMMQGRLRRPRAD